MKTMTATSASRGFSELLDSVEAGAVVRITRDGRPVAELRPVSPTTGRNLRLALTASTLDDDFAADIAAAVDLLTHENGHVSWPDD